ncbi:MAG: hypothetical protein HQ567_34765 [Candidatus Nealsonbacteria bacterium]|nr:hypothetical protein [Candidatus Nealsonbacteria bacterium]
MADDYAQLARRMSSFTTKCMLTGIVLVAGLGFGRQVLRWWAEEETSGAGLAQPADGLGDPLRPHLLQFGDLPWSLRRQTVVGSKESAAAALREIGLATVREEKDPILPDDEPLDAERKLLAALATSKPVAEQPGRWALYESAKGFPMIVATRPEPAAKRVASASDPGKSDPGKSGSRIAVWGFAFPADSDAWTVCTFQPASPSASGGTDVISEVIPPDCTRTLSVRVVGGGAVIGFCGSGRVETRKIRFDDHFARNNWRMVGPWRNTGAAWHVRYEKSDWAVDVRFGPGGGDAGANNQFSGLLVVTPSRAVEDQGP